MSGVKKAAAMSEKGGKNKASANSELVKLFDITPHFATVEQKTPTLMLRENLADLTNFELFHISPAGSNEIQGTDYGIMKPGHLYVFSSFCVRSCY